MCIVIQKRLDVLLHCRVMLIGFDLISRCDVVRVRISITNGHLGAVTKTIDLVGMVDLLVDDAHIVVY
jgi:hypothetical protein